MSIYGLLFKEITAAGSYSDITLYLAVISKSHLKQMRFYNLESSLNLMEEKQIEPVIIINS